MDADDILSLDTAEGACLADYAERARVGDWSLRSALVRYAQRAPVAASAVLELIRRTDAALHPFRRSLDSSPVREIAADDDGGPGVVDLLRVAAVLDELADLLVGWANDRSAHEVPTEAVDALAGRAFQMLAALEVPRETRPPRRTG
ncbi:hypothetical protein [Actinospongicola halichondriae]|uniref:hypothetical protein n=1 Tax=Actinospongicola halichondriae TaxID=3236844 RepID=UPI003D47294C